MADTYRPPILAQIFRVLGGLSLLVTVLALAVGVLSARNMGSGENAAAVYWAFFIPIASGVFTSLLLFGTGQVIEYIGQTAYYSRRIFDVLDRTDTLAGSRWRDVQTALNNIAANAKKSAASAGAPTQPALPAAPAAPASTAPLTVRRYFYLDLDNQVAGPVPEAKLPQLVTDGTISDDTQVCREGSENWQTLSEAIGSQV